ncbi:TIGR02281 family clan AA aspartic protease [Anatilimnocola sp. NA78]|uniref:retropepsin-like aspartic protease family protein n=1 Tax=Anatilimnocola sp. NA78 TaxID=3415683 RepID=UPI003CE56A7A
MSTLIRVLVAGLLVVTLSSTFSIAQEKPAAENAAAAITLTPSEAKAALETAGFKVTTTGVSLPAEAEFAKQVKDITTVRKSYLAAEKELAVAELELEQVKATITTLKTNEVQYNAALAAGNLTVDNHNRLVGALNAIGGQIDLGLQQQGKSTDKVRAARGKSNAAREAYTEKLLEVRSAADKVEQAWSKAAADPKNQAAMAKVNEVLKKSLALKPTPVFTVAERQLAQLEDKILSENIALRDDDATLWASVMINGKHTKEMIVDSGAQSLALPYAMAKEMGLEPMSTDPRITLILADGREIPGFQKTLGSVRVGKFLVEGVDCVVMDESAVAARPLLGMSFLGNFKFEVDKARAILKMVKVDEEANASKRDAAKKKEQE